MLLLALEPEHALAATALPSSPCLHSPSCRARPPSSTLQIPPDISSDPTAFLPRLQIVCLGDSLTQRGSEPEGWVTLLTHWYSRKADVLNRGYSGYNTNHALALMKTHIARGIWPTPVAAASATAAPAAAAVPFEDARSYLVTLFFGANDSCLPGSISDAQSVGLAQYRSNLALMVQLLKGADGTQNPRVHVVIIGPPQCDSLTWGLVSQQRHKLAAPPVTRDNTHTKLYSEAARSVSEQFRVPFVHTYSFTSNWNQSLCDGLHFTPRSNHKLFSVLQLVIKQHYPALSAAERPLDSFPFLQIKTKELAEVERMFEERAKENDEERAQAAAAAAAGNKEAAAAQTKDQVASEAAASSSGSS